jgi:hypothetical protein
LFYRRFVKYAKVTVPITDLLKKPSGSEEWEWTQEADVAFQKLKHRDSENL